MENVACQGGRGGWRMGWVVSAPKTIVGTIVRRLKGASVRQKRWTLSSEPTTKISAACSCCRTPRQQQHVTLTETICCRGSIAMFIFGSCGSGMQETQWRWKLRAAPSPSDGSARSTPVRAFTPPLTNKIPQINATASSKCFPHSFSTHLQEEYQFGAHLSSTSKTTSSPPPIAPAKAHPVHLPSSLPCVCVPQCNANAAFASKVWSVPTPCPTWTLLVGQAPAQRGTGGSLTPGANPTAQASPFAKPSRGI